MTVTSIYITLYNPTRTHAPTHMHTHTRTYPHTYDHKHVQTLTHVRTYLFNKPSEHSVLATKGSCTFPPSDTYLLSGTVGPGGGWGTIPVRPRDRALPVAWGIGTLRDPEPEIPSNSDICLLYCLFILSAHTSSRRTLGGLFG